MTACSLSELGYVYLLEGRLEDAEKIFRDSLQRFEQNKHVNIYIVLENLASLYLKKYEQAVTKRDNPHSFLRNKLSIT